MSEELVNLVWFLREEYKPDNIQITPYEGEEYDLFLRVCHHYEQDGWYANHFSVDKVFEHESEFEDLSVTAGSEDEHIGSYSVDTENVGTTYMTVYVKE